MCVIYVYEYNTYLLSCVRHVYIMYTVQPDGHIIDIPTAGSAVPPPADVCKFDNGKIWITVNVKIIAQQWRHCITSTYFVYINDTETNLLIIDLSLGILFK